MSNIEMEGMGITEGRLGPVEQWLAKSEEEKKQQLIQAVVADRIEFAKFFAECYFLKDLHVCFMSPKNFPSTQCYEQFAKVFGYPPSIRKKVTSLQASLENWVSLDRKLDNLKDLIVINDQLEACVFHAVQNTYLNLQKMDNLLNTMAAKCSNWNIEDWTTIQKIFEQKQLPFSHEFVKRCERVAQKGIAA